jgi:hypothetical protein
MKKTNRTPLASNKRFILIVSIGYIYCALNILLKKQFYYVSLIITLYWRIILELSL